MGTRSFLACAFLLAVAAANNAQEAPRAAPGQATIKRAAADAAMLLPQTGVGGDDTGKVTPNKTSFEEIDIGVEGCEKMKGYVALPEGLDKQKKYALFFMFHGNGDGGKGRVKNLSNITTARDPIITIGVQYQQLKEDGSTAMNQPLACSGAKILEGCEWLLKKVMDEQPVDPDRVFVGGFSMGCGYAGGWARRRWTDSPDTYPFRAVFQYGGAGGVDQKTCPPVPWVCICGEKETAVLGVVNVVADVRKFCNAMAAWGKPVLYHEIPGMGHQVNGRCHQVTRDIINQLGGPGALPYAAAEAGATDALPFDVSEDKYVKEVVALCNADDWHAALARVKAIDDDKAIDSKDKRAVKHFDKEIEKVAKKEVKRVDDLIAAAIKAEKMPPAWQIRRMRAISESWRNETWIKDKGYDTRLTFLATDFPPVKREAERHQQMRDALALESQKGKRADARKLYETLSARENEDEGKSIWPRAAKYRLTWWINGD